MGYYLDSNGNCISYKENLQIIDNCLVHNFMIGNLSFQFQLIDDMNEIDISLQKKSRYNIT